MTWNGCFYPAYKNGDDWGMVYDCFTGDIVGIFTIKMGIWVIYCCFTHIIVI